jgi:hypothetical protein
MLRNKNEVPALTGDSSLTFVFPISVAIQLGVGNREVLRYFVDGDRLIVEKKHRSRVKGQTTLMDGDY